MADSRRHRWCARSLCHFVLAGGLRRQIALGDVQYPPRRTGLLWRADRRVARLHPLRPFQKTAALENRRHPRAQHCAGRRLWPHRLPDERLLLWPRVRFAVGDSFSKRPRDAWPWRAPDRNLRGIAGFLSLPFPRPGLSPQEIRWPNFRAVPALLRCAPGVRGNVSRRLYNLLPERTRHAGASVEHVHFCRRRIALVGVVRGKTKSPQLKIVISRRRMSPSPHPETLLVVEKTMPHERVDTFLRARSPTLSRSAIHRLIQQDDVRVA